MLRRLVPAFVLLALAACGPPSPSTAAPSPSRVPSDEAAVIAAALDSLYARSGVERVVVDAAVRGGHGPVRPMHVESVG